MAEADGNRTRQGPFDPSTVLKTAEPTRRSDASARERTLLAMTIRRQGDDHLDVTGLVREPLAMSVAEIAALPGRAPKAAGSSQGDAVPVSALLAEVDADPGADHATVSSGDGHYRASIPLDQLRDGGWLFVDLDHDGGGPLRLVVEDGRTLCWNVKHVIGLHLTSGPEPDSVPENPPH